MMNLITGRIKADAMYVTIQKEVAERMTAEPGNKNYGTLSILLAAAGDIKTIRTLKPSVFWPQPQVNSAIISFIRSQEKVYQIKDMQLFSDVINLFMQHRRKMLKAAVKFACGRLKEIKSWPDIFNIASIDSHKRPEELSPQDYVTIANLCHENLNK